VVTGDVTVRQATSDDVEFVQEMLYQAANRPGDEWPTLEESLQEPRNVRFWRDFGRAGDLGVIAERDGQPIAAAWIRFFHDDELSPIDDPGVAVLAIGVVESERGRRVGSMLMSQLVELARRAGVRAISLTTGLFNETALRLYEAHGFTEVLRHGDGVQMRLDL
jgi:GNAT superfamily N-acetyltransferase